MKQTFKVLLAFVFTLFFSTNVLAAIVNYENKDITSIMYGTYSFDTVTKQITVSDLYLNYSSLGAVFAPKFTTVRPNDDPSSSFTTLTHDTKYSLSTTPNAVWSYNGYASMSSNSPEYWSIVAYAFHYKYATPGGIIDFKTADTFITFNKVAAVPEPESYAMFLAGLLVVSSRRKLFS